MGETPKPPFLGAEPLTPPQHCLLPQTPYSSEGRAPDPSPISPFTPNPLGLHMVTPSVPSPQEGLLSHFGTPTWQTITIFAAGVLTASLTIWKMS